MFILFILLLKFLTFKVKELLLTSLTLLTYLLMYWYPEGIYPAALGPTYAPEGVWPFAEELLLGML
jgi:hypothetical protein